MGLVQLIALIVAAGLMPAQEALTRETNKLATTCSNGADPGHFRTDFARLTSRIVPLCIPFPAMLLTVRSMHQAAFAMRTRAPCSGGKVPSNAPSFL